MPIVETRAMPSRSTRAEPRTVNRRATPLTSRRRCAPSVQYEVPVGGVVYGTLPIPQACWCTPTCACLETQNLCSSGANATSCTDGNPIVLGCPQ
jgi:hypothetical protein